MARYGRCSRCGTELIICPYGEQGGVVCPVCDCPGCEFEGDCWGVSGGWEPEWREDDEEEDCVAVWVGDC